MAHSHCTAGYMRLNIHCEQLTRILNGPYSSSYGLTYANVKYPQVPDVLDLGANSRVDSWIAVQ